MAMRKAAVQETNRNAIAVAWSKPNRIATFLQ